MLITGYEAPGASASLRSHETVGALTVHDQPGPLAAVGVNPAGNASLTVTVPLVAAAPRLRTVMVNGKPPLPWTASPVWFLVITRSAVGGGTGGRMTTASCAELFSACLSASLRSVATFTRSLAVGATSTVSVMSGNAWPGATVSLRLHVASGPTMPHDQPGPATAVGVRPAGSVSVTITIPVDSRLATLETRSANVRPVSPAVKFPVCDFEIVRSRSPCATNVRSCAVLFEVLPSPPPSTIAVLTTLPAFADTSTTTAIVGYALPGASGSDRVHVTTCPCMPQPQPEPDAAVGVKPLGTLSRTLTVPVVALSPLFWTSIRYVPLRPCWNSPSWCLRIVRSDGPGITSTAVGSSAKSFAGLSSPSAETRAVLVTLVAVSATATAIEMTG